MNVRGLIVTTRSASATVYACPFCRHFYRKVRKGQTGVGRGHGFRAASWAHSDVVAHIREAHADRLVPQNAARSDAPRHSEPAPSPVERLHAGMGSAVSPANDRTNERDAAKGNARVAIAARAREILMNGSSLLTMAEAMEQAKRERFASLPAPARSEPSELERRRAAGRRGTPRH